MGGEKGFHHLTPQSGEKKASNFVRQTLHEEEFAGSEKLEAGPLANPSAEPSCRNAKFPRILGARGDQVCRPRSNRPKQINANRAGRFLCFSLLGCCERVLRFVGREVQWRLKLRMQAVKWAVAKLQGDKKASFCREMSGREVTGR